MGEEIGVRRGKTGNKIAMLLLGGVAVFFMSCEKEVLSGAGGRIKINFTLSDTPYGENEQITRSAKALASETVIVPVNEDFCMYATLQETEEAPLRASALEEGTKLVIVAYNGGGYVDDEEYEVTASGGLLGSSSLDLPSAGNYTFVAYSLNTTSVPAYASAGGPYLSGSDDLLCVKESNVPIVDGDNDVTLVMRHLFSKVTMTASTEDIAGTPAISAIDAHLEGFEADLDVANGAVSPGSSENQSFTWSELVAGSTVTSDERRVYTGGASTTYVKISSVTIGGYTYIDSPAASFAMTLLAGKTYTLAVDFKKKLAFAGSNIYWDGFKLTFKEAGYTGPENYYQGVLFKWGSLIGISPAGLQFDAFTTSTPVYTPTFVSTSNKNWSKYITYSEWHDIDPVKDNVAGDRYSTYLMDDARNTDNDYAYWKAKKGDICRYISENGYGPEEGGVKYGYRMPTLYELGAKNMPNGSYITYSYDGPEGWKNEGIIQEEYDFSISGADGMRVMSRYAFNSVVGTILPASGCRYPDVPSKGDLARVGDMGYYWSGSTSDATNPLNLNDGGWAMLFTFHSLNFSAYGHGSYAFSIRCVRNN